MTLNNLLTLNKVTSLTVQHRCISTTLVRPLIQKWRKEHGLPTNPNSYGVLTDKPDYTFLDGRPTPLGMNQKARVLKNREITQKIIQLSSEIDFAVERHKRIQKENEQMRKDILSSKLKPKGDLLLKK